MLGAMRCDGGGRVEACQWDGIAQLKSELGEEAKV